MNKSTLMVYIAAGLSIAALPTALYVPKFEKQSFTPPHKRPGKRGKLKRSGR
jgi:hypothetical protein